MGFLQNLGEKWVENIFIITRIPPGIYFEDSRSQRTESLVSGMLQLAHSFDPKDPYFQETPFVEFEDDDVATSGESTITTQMHALSSAAREIVVSLHSPGGVPRFIRALNRRRCKDHNIGVAYPFFAGLLLSLLNICWNDNAVDPVLNIMMLALSFYRYKDVNGTFDGVTGSQETTQKKEFLKSALETHPVWRSNLFWQRALELSIAKYTDGAIDEEMNVMPIFPNGCPSIIIEEIVFSSLSCWQEIEKNVMGKTDALEKQMERKMVIFGQMSGLVHAMLDFKISTHEVLNFIERVCNENGLLYKHRLEMNKHVYALEDNGGL